MKRTTFLPTLLGVLVIASAVPASAKLPWVKKAQGLGFADIKNCASCHSTEKPKKNEPLNDLGKFLMDQKAKKKAAEVDLAWIKDFPKK